jgi:hypothetical protein
MIPGLILYGMFLELLQGMTGYRVMDGGDMLANGFGVISALVIRITPLPELCRKWERQWFDFG